MQSATFAYNHYYNSLVIGQLWISISFFVIFRERYSSSILVTYDISLDHQQRNECLSEVRL
ncbi:hypothetical protein [Moorena producens]|uniref:hypothetical protein n=1 Tax=Moorena producens TaxID=1155739 RepID=UPI0011EA6D3E|nr:hypothetical protein [Moorena producens]